MKPIDLSENNAPITPEQVETPVGCGGACGGKCGTGKTKSCCRKCCCVLKTLVYVLVVALVFYAGYLYGQH